MAAGADMTGRTCLITGATSGIGRAAALALARLGASLVLVGRSRERGEHVVAEVERASGRQDAALLLVADLSSQAEVRRLAAEFLATGRPLHVLLNNAGIVNLRRETTVDGREATFAVNHLAYFLLTELLLPRLKESAPARIVSVASDAHAQAGGRLDFEDLDSRRYSSMRVYGKSKLANILFTRELARRLEGTGVTANCLHPGFVGSGFARNNGAVASLVMSLLRPFARSPEKGAETAVYLASSPEVAGVSGRYFVDCRPRSPKDFAQNDADARRLWEVSERLCGLATA